MSHELSEREFNAKVIISHLQCTKDARYRSNICKNLIFITSAFFQILMFVSDDDVCHFIVCFVKLMKCGDLCVHRTNINHNIGVNVLNNDD